MIRSIQIDEQLFLTVRATPATPQMAGSEALLHGANSQRELAMCGGWRVPIQDDDGSVELFGDLAAYAFAADERDARRKLLALATWLDLHATHIRAEDCMLAASEICESMDRIRPELTIHWSREMALRIHASRDARVVPFVRSIR